MQRSQLSEQRIRAPPKVAPGSGRGQSVHANHRVVPVDLRSEPPADEHAAGTDNSAPAKAEWHTQHIASITLRQHLAWACPIARGRRRLGSTTLNNIACVAGGTVAHASVRERAGKLVSDTPQ